MILYADYGERPISARAATEYIHAMNPSAHPPGRLASIPSFFPLTAVLCGTLAVFAGCASDPVSHVVSAPPPATPAASPAVTTTTTTTAPAAPSTIIVGNTAYVAAAAPAVSTIVVTQAPPAMQTEVVLAQPSTRHVWIPGFWTWRNARYEWMAGHWELPPSQSSVWVAPRWELSGNAYRFYEGYWN